MFDINSRYYSLEDKFLTRKDGEVIAYKGRRFLPPLPKVGHNNKTITQIRYAEGDRLDLMAARMLGDPLSFWQIVDVNTAMHPRKLTEKAGNTINVPLIPLQINPII